MPRTEAVGGRRDFMTRGAHLAALSGLAFAQPLYDLLSTDPSALVATDLMGFALVLFVAAIALGPPIALLCLEALADAIHTGFARILHLLLVGGFVTLFVLQAHTSVDLPEKVLLPVAAGTGVFGALLYRRSQGIRFALLVLAPAPVLFAALFVFSPAISPLLDTTQPRVSSASQRPSAPVVLVVFDELPVASLLDRSARIDRARYPSFARLARGATWFRNAVSVDASSPWAVPAIMTGNYPDPNRPPAGPQHPRSIFTLLSGYDARAFEPVTRICPADRCERDGSSAPARALTAAGLLSEPSVNRLLPPSLAYRALRVTRLVQRLLGADPTSSYIAAKLRIRRAEFAQFVDSIEPGRRPGLYVLHTLFPHGPWNFLPSGGEYQTTRYGLAGGRWVDDPDLVAQSWQQHLLQVEYTDRLLGTVLRKLEREGMYDETLIAVVADHGINFTRGGHPRAVSRRSVEQLAPVPFILKAPGQRRGEVRDAPLETVDVLPTIADALGVRLPWKTDGVSGFSARQARRPPSRMSEGGEGHVRVPRTRLIRGGETLARRDALFGSGRDRRQLFTLGAWAELVGRRVPARTLTAERSARVRLVDGERFETVKPAAGTVPAQVEGTIEGSTRRARRDLAVAMNGRIRAVTRSFIVDGSERFAAVLPEEAFRAGLNEITVLAVRRQAGRPLLTRLPSVG